MVDFGHCGDSAFAATPAGSLLDADRWRNTSDQIHIGTRELLDELPGIDVHRIEETALAFSEKQIERERAFAGPAHTRDHHELAPRKAKREILEIMLARAMDGDGRVRDRNQMVIVEHDAVELGS